MFETLVAPSRELSRPLRFIAGYFTVSAVLISLTWLGTLGAALSGVKMLAPLLHFPWYRYLAIPLTVAMWWQVGRLLRNRQREGGYWALAALTLPLATRMLGHPARASNTDLVISVVGLVLIALVWRELE